MARLEGDPAQYLRLYDGESISEQTAVANFPRAGLEIRTLVENGRVYVEEVRDPESRFVVDRVIKLKSADLLH